MPRIDLRVKQPIRGEIITSLSAKQEKRYPVIVSNISLGGALVEGNMPEMDHFSRIHLKIKDQDNVVLPAHVLRHDKNKLGLYFYYENEAAIKYLWHYIRENIAQIEKGTCPYCGKPLAGGHEECDKCNMDLNFSADYLAKHTRRTFFERLALHLNDSNGNSYIHLLNVIDREILNKSDEDVFEEYVGTSPQMLELFSLIRKVAPTEMPVLLLGESGTGKELAARAIHERGSRTNQPLYIINCAAIPEALLEAELFGYEKGAFTGAYQARKGKFELADGGTLFLDEIGDMPWPLQSKILRFLEDKTIERIGSQKSRKVDARIIAATNRDLEREVFEERFRRDLYFRLNVFPIHLPPLRERGVDKIVLAKYFLKKFCQESLASRGKQFSAEALAAINRYNWPGNVRELINKVRKGIVISEGEEITAGDLDLDHFSVAKTADGATLKEIRSSFLKNKLVETIDSCGGNLSLAARELGVSRTTMHKLKKKHLI